MNDESVILESKHSINLQQLGFKSGKGSVHNSRTLMLPDLRSLISYMEPADAPKKDYLEAIQIGNCLGKRSAKTRSLACRHLVDIYALDPNVLVFRALRFFWSRDVVAQPLLAALCAFSRDPIFRATAPYVLSFDEGMQVKREDIEAHVDLQEPGRFSEATLKSTAQNLNASFTQTGHLSGRVKKVRSRAVASAGSVSFALLLGYVSGLRGESLLKSNYTQMLDCSVENTIDLAEEASRRGWISLKRVGKVVEVLFPSLITTQEMDLLREQN